MCVHWMLNRVKSFPAETKKIALLNISLFRFFDKTPEAAEHNHLEMGVEEKLFKLETQFDSQTLSRVMIPVAAAERISIGKIF